MTKSTIIKLNPHKVFLSIEFDKLLGSDFVEHYKAIVDLQNKQLGFQNMFFTRRTAINKLNP